MPNTWLYSSYFVLCSTPKVTSFKCQILGFILNYGKYNYLAQYCLNAKYLALFGETKYQTETSITLFKCQILGFIRMMLQNLKAMQHGLNAKYLALFL